MKSIRCTFMLIVLLYADAASAQHYPPTFLKAGDSLVFFRGADAWYLPSGKRYNTFNAPVKVEPAKDLTKISFTSVSTAKGQSYYVLAKTSNIVLGRGGKKSNEICLLEADPAAEGKYRKLQELDPVYELIQEETKANRKMLFAGTAENKRIYFSMKDVLYSIADDGSDAKQPREELPAIGGLSVLDFRLTPNGRYALMMMVPTSQPSTSGVVGNEGMSVRLFDLKAKQAVLDVRPEDFFGCTFSADNRYFIYQGFDSTYHYDLQEKKVVSKHFKGLLMGEYNVNYWFYVDDRYLYIVSSLANNVGCYIKVRDLKQNSWKFKYGQLL
ncbi:MAG: hypothetical protein ACTHMC_18725 [Pseudobacter sp.]|uniref:hypothetical protein n=1 Tax=Pseudobacter sp. TaxID=2045420 RepID=UPI003F80FA71